MSRLNKYQVAALKREGIDPEDCKGLMDRYHEKTGRRLAFIDAFDILSDETY